MTTFERFAVSQGAAEIEAALADEFLALGIDVPRCDLVGAQNNTVVQVTVHAAGREPIRFNVAQEDVVDGSLRGRIEIALKAAGEKPEG